MLTFQDFLSQNDGKFISLLQPGKQCFDLVVAWTDNLGIPHVAGNPSPFPFQYAYQIYTSFGADQEKYFTLIPNGPDNAPQSGDIIVWSYTYNYAGGHTGVATGESQTLGHVDDWFKCFVQNDPNGSPCEVKQYSYSDVLGWLRPKNYQLLLTDSQKIEQIKTWINDSSIAREDFYQKVKTLLGV